MKKFIILLLILTIVATPSHALSILERIVYKEVQLDSQKVLVNQFTGRVDKILINGQYQPISTQKGFGGIISDQEMYQAQYDNKIGK